MMSLDSVNCSQPSFICMPDMRNSFHSIILVARELFYPFPLMSKIFPKFLCIEYNISLLGGSLIRSLSDSTMSVMCREQTEVVLTLGKSQKSMSQER